MKRVFYLAMAFALGCGSVSALAEEADPGYEAVAITKVYGDGQKVAAVALQYGEEIDADSVEVADYQVTDYEITDVYVNSEAALTDENQGGCYVIVLLDTSELSDDYNVDMSISPQGHEGGNTAPSEREASAEEDEEESSEEDGEAFSGEDAEEHSYPVSDISSSNGLSNQLSVSITQVGDVSSVSGTVYEGSDTAIETDYQENINLVVDEFEQDVYTSPDDENSTLMYNLYLPEGYSDEAEYPLVLFMPDASADSSDPVKTLTQGLGAVIWAEEENQTENPCIVLAPQYKNDTDSVENTMGLLAQIVETYSVDESRIYLAGQSAGTIRAITLMIENPDTFAAALLVTGLADDDYEERLS
ncbi:MAG: hypothetical protein LUF30_07825, partial [Lachnospiraceae bacterium]|nr:hypothetical protein [Lachnospiraceae bacterium]